MLKIENVDIKSIKPYKNNPRNNDEAVEYVANSIKEFGFKVPIVVDKNNEIVTGHTRYKASQKLGLKEVPIIRADELNEEQIKAFRIADNKVGEFSLWNYESLEEELKKIDDAKVELYKLKEENNSIIDLLEKEGLHKNNDTESDSFAVSFTDKIEKIRYLKDYAKENGKAKLNDLFFDVIKEGFEDGNN